MPVYGHHKFHWFKEPVIEIDQDPPVIDTYYPALSTTRLTKIYYIAIRRADDDAVAKSVQLRIIIDGVSRTNNGVSQDDDTWYYWYEYPNGSGQNGSTTFQNSALYDCLMGHSISIDVRQYSDAIGANAELDARIQYATWRPT